MTEPQFVDAVPPALPSGTRGRYDWDAIVTAIKDRPGEWLLIDSDGNRSLATAIRNRKMRALKDPGWEFTPQVRKNDGAQTWSIYISAERIDPNGG